MGTASIGGVIGPTLAGWVYDTLGSYHLVWLLLTGFICLNVFLVTRLEKAKESAG